MFGIIHIVRLTITSGTRTKNSCETDLSQNRNGGQDYGNRICQISLWYTGLVFTQLKGRKEIDELHSRSKKSTRSWTTQIYRL